MKFEPYPFQKIGIDHAVEVLRNKSSQLYAAPTGCGKSIIELYVQQFIEGAWIVSPSTDIIDGMMKKLGRFGQDPVENRICTPVRLRNLLLRGDVDPPKALIFDETHHQTADSWQHVHLLSGLCPHVGYTATPYRGSPASTRTFLEQWGEPLWVITYEQAAAMKYVTVPDMLVLPLVDDDIVEVKGGEFEILSLEGATLDRLGDMAEQSRKWYDKRWDKPTIYALPSTSCCVRLRQELLQRGLPCAIVNADTPQKERDGIFEAAEAGIMAILHINIVTEGVDLKLRRLVDLAPTMSPVKWVQQMGRITRPLSEGEPTSEYVGTNKNILRHGYILEGVLPMRAIADAEEAFGGPSARGAVRVLGTEAIGRFKPATAKTVSGCTVNVYCVSAVVGGTVVEYCALVHPGRDAIWASRVNGQRDGVRTYGSWRKCEAPNDLMGFGSISPKEPSPKQKAWWGRSAAKMGLKPDQEVNRKSFSVLPVLMDLGVRLT